MKNSFDTKCWNQWKDQKSSYRVKQIVALFCILTALILGENSVKCIRVTEIAKEIKFEEVCGELESKKVSRDNQSQNIWD